MTNGDVHVHVFMKMVRKDDKYKYSYDERSGEGYHIYLFEERKIFQTFIKSTSSFTELF